MDYGKLNKGITVGVVEKIHFALEYNCHMTMKQATTKFGSDVVSESGMKEMKQMLDMRVMDAIAPEEARRLRKKGFKFTRTFMFYKDKYDIDGKLEKVKGRFVNMELKRNKHPHDSNKRTAGNAMAESINTTLADAADKGKQIAVIDVVGAYLHASAGNVKKYLIIDKNIADILCKLKPELSKLRDQNGLLYAKKNKALYGSTDAAELWYTDISSYLKSIGFVANPYDNCVFNLFNKKTNNIMITIALHVDDLLVTSKETRLLEWVRDKLKAKYGDVSYKTGKRLKYLGINIIINDDGNIDLDCEDVFTEMLKDYKIQNKSIYPAGRGLFNIRGNGTALSEAQRSEYLSRIMKIQYYAKKVRVDLLPTLAFLRTRVSVATTEDWDKLTRLLYYINETKSQRMSFKKGGSMLPEVSVDTSHGTHSDRKGHTGIIARLGNSTIYVSSTKQKLVTRSSFECELVGLGNATQWIKWWRNFLIHQRMIKEDHCIQVWQDNKSTILAALQGRSNSRRTKHIDIRYFEVKELVEEKKIKITYMPTDQMTSDFMTKPLQGGAFLRIRGIIMNNG